MYLIAKCRGHALPCIWPEEGGPANLRGLLQADIINLCEGSRAMCSYMRALCFLVRLGACRDWLRDPVELGVCGGLPGGGEVSHAGAENIGTGGSSTFDFPFISLRGFWGVFLGFPVRGRTGSLRKILLGVRRAVKIEVRLTVALGNNGAIGGRAVSTNTCMWKDWRSFHEEMGKSGDGP